MNLALLLSLVAFLAGAVLAWVLKPTLTAETLLLTSRLKAELYAAQTRLHEAEAKLLALAGRKAPPPSPPANTAVASGDSTPPPVPGAPGNA